MTTKVARYIYSLVNQAVHLINLPLSSFLRNVKNDGKEKVILKVRLMD